MKGGHPGWMHSLRPGLVCVLTLWGFSLATGTSTIRAQESGLKIQITRVEPLRGRVQFSVLESDGSPRTALEAGDFEFRLAGTRIHDVRLQSFEDDSTSRLMVVLGFGSAHMTRTQARNLMVAASRHFLVDMNEAKPDRAAILTFADDVEVPAHFSADPIRLGNNLRRLKFSGRDLKLYDGLKAGRQLLLETDTVGYGVLIFAVDQRDTSSQYDLRALKADIARGNFPPVFTIGLGADSALAHNLKEVSAMSGGECFLIAPRSNRLTHTYHLILEMLHHQYVATLSDHLLEGEVEIVYHASDGTEIAARILLPTNSPVSVPSYGNGKPQRDWRQAMLLIVLAGLLVVLGAVRMGWVDMPGSRQERPQDLPRPQKWSAQKSKPAGKRRNERATH